MKKIAVIGGGAAGLIAAGTAHELGASVTLFEKNAKLGRKVAITGKGRCNVTNNCSETEFMSNVVTNPRFLYSALSVFSPADTMEFFESRKVKLKTERGNRVFPVSDRAYDIVDALGAYVLSSRGTLGYVDFETDTETEIASFRDGGIDRITVTDRYILVEYQHLGRSCFVYEKGGSVIASTPISG